MATMPDGFGGVKGVKARFKNADQRRELVRSNIQELYDYAIPNRETFNYHSPGQRKNRHIYDSTLVIGVQKFVSRIIGSTTPEGMSWFKFEAGSDIPEDQKEEVNKELDKASEIFFRYFNQSNYHSKVQESHQDMSISTGALLIERGDERRNEPLIKFSCIPLPELYIEPTTLERIHSWWRKWEMVAQEIPLHYPSADIPAELQKVISDSPMSMVTIHDGTLMNMETQETHQVVLWKDELLFTQPYTTSPGIIYRWSVIPGETYGRGPVDSVIANARTANKVKEFELKAAALALAPPLLGVSDGIFNPHTARVEPGTVMPVSNIDSVRPLMTGADLNFSQIALADEREQINKIMHANPMGDLSDPVRSATEMVIREQEMLKDEGAQMARLVNEFLIPMVNRVLDILKQDGKIHPISVNGRQVSLKMQSPMAQIQSMEDVNKLMTWMGIIGQIAQFSPEAAILGANVEMIPQWSQKQLGLPEKLARTEAEIKEGKAALMAQAQQQAQQQAPQGQGAPVA